MANDPRNSLLLSARDLLTHRIEARDGTLGKVEDIFFDDLTWQMRYLVANTGGWLLKNTVLLSPAAVREVRGLDHRISVDLTRQQIRESPDLETHPPVSRIKEARYFDHYRWPYYWNGTGLWGTTGIAYDRPRPDAPPGVHLKSVQEVRGYHISATDRELGHVVDFLLDERAWQLRYLVVDTRNWWPSPWVLIACPWVEGIDWELKRIRVDVVSEVIRHAPPYERHAPLPRGY
jgi:hypothetical protein